MKKYYRFFLILFPIIFLNKVAAAPPNTAFADDQFYNCIVVKLNTDGFNSVYDRDATTHEVTKEELESITVLKCNESSISNVKGLELLTNLTDLNLSDNSISSIDLTKNTKITNLLLSNNKLSTIDLSKNVAIENLYLNGNNLSALNLKNNTNLLVLNVNNNKLAGLDLTSNNKIMDFKASDNAFKTITKYLFKGDSLTLVQDIKFPSDNTNIQSWLTPIWSTKDANIATVNQKGTVRADKSGTVLIVASVEDVYSINYSIKVSEITSDVYNIDDVNSNIAVDNASIKTILSNINVVNGEPMIYNASNKYVTSGNISNDFKLKVIQDAQVLKTYTLTLVKDVVNNDLESLEIKNYSIDFDKDKTNYTVIVEDTVDKIEIVAKAVEPSAKVKIEGNEALEAGTNTVTITITGEDNTTKTYTISVIKKSKEAETQNNTSNVYLEKLEIKGYKIDFDKKVDYYNVKVDGDTKKLEIKATAADNQASVTINGNRDLKNKSKIEIVVSALDGSKKTYIINVEKDDSNDFKLILTILELVALFLLILLCIILISKHKKKKKKNANNISSIKTDMKEKVDEPTREFKKVSNEKILGSSRNPSETTREFKRTSDENLLNSLKNSDIEATKEFSIISTENTVNVSKKKVDDYTKTDAYLEKTLRFRRVCPKCGAINVLTNEECYMCGVNLDEK